MQRRLVLLALAFLAGSCRGYRIPGDRSILDWWSNESFTGDYALVPALFDGPDEHRCAADPTRVYIAELFSSGIDDVEVNWHWAPLIPGPDDARPTIDQPEYSLAGTIAGVDDSDDDVLADHPFGLDVNADVIPDAPYSFLDGDEDGPGAALHTEVETRIFPRAALGFTPAPGDRALMHGVWVLDCGHPPYGTEMHPPTFLNYARAVDATSTVSAAVVVPYRSSLLFNPNLALADDFSSVKRFKDADTKPFEEALIDAILHAVINSDDHLEAHALMVPNRFDTFDWRVCAPLPKPPDSILSASWRFTTRTGVSIRAERHDAAGCIRFTAHMDGDYQPMPLPYADEAWSWEQLSASASSQLGQPIDVRQAIIDALTAQGLDPSMLPAFQEDHPPRVDAYTALAPHPGADQDSPAGYDTNADDQPFPLYGRVSVRWIPRN